MFVGLHIVGCGVQILRHDWDSWDRTNLYGQKSAHNADHFNNREEFHPQSTCILFQCIHTAITSVLMSDNNFEFSFIVDIKIFHNLFEVSASVSTNNLA